MATGYTTYIGRGCDFKTFALQCARAFCACEPFGTSIPENFKPSNYHLDAKRGAERKLKKFKGFKKADWEKLAKKGFKREVSECAEFLNEARTLLSKYQSMLEKVRLWNPPTDEHQNLKKFMIEQIESSIKFDCDVEYHERNLRNIKQKKWMDFKDEQITGAIHDISYHERGYKKEAEKAQKNSEWVKALRESLK